MTRKEVADMQRRFDEQNAAFDAARQRRAQEQWFKVMLGRLPLLIVLFALLIAVF